jgi:DNA helicase II / ATP-dependent DNA helicase PcrA
LQEQIYLILADRAPFNVVVVGDDDQALYRFRGGSVECMVTFDQACRTYLGVSATGIAPYPLVDNFRSHPDIVDFCNEYISAFPSMAQPRARVPGKPRLEARSTIGGNYPAVGQLRGNTLSAVADRFAATVHDLRANGVIQDYSQCCLLLKSTKETPLNAQPYVAALQNRGIPVYNPRNKAFLEQEEVQGLLGALMALTDPQGLYVPSRPAALAQLAGACQAEFRRIAAAAPELDQYVTRANANLAAHPGERVTANLQELVYYLLALPPFDR